MSDKHNGEPVIFPDTLPEKVIIQIIHDCRAPLAAIKGFSEVLKQHPAAGTMIGTLSHQEIAHHIYRLAEKMEMSFLSASNYLKARNEQESIDEKMAQPQNAADDGDSAG
jgi:K+-sensing histidine kinase KdpD